MSLLSELGVTSARKERFHSFRNYTHTERNREWNRDRWRRNNNNVYRNDGYYGNGGYGNYGYNNQYEVNRGYQEGLNTGASDARRGQSFNPQRSHWYKDARMQGFRQGFLQGYNQGFRQYSYNNGGYRNRNYGGGILGGIFGRP